MEALPANSEASKPPTPGPPVHVAIIMDGNGRWAKSRGLPRIAGHKRGAEAVRRTVKAAAELGIGYLTLYGFSSENWKRPPTEVDDLMALLRLYLASEIEELDRNGVRLRVIGQRARLHPDIVELIRGAEGRTAGNARLNLTVALSYGGRAEIAEAARCLARAARAGELDPESIDEVEFERHLLTAGLPDPDLLIRTSGEKRVSNFLLWQCAYAELVFLDRLWPDFAREDLEFAIREYHGRDRRYGAAR
jgi:undecaprenyl diphosphate synthase